MCQQMFALKCYYCKEYHSGDLTEVQLEQMKTNNTCENPPTVECIGSEAKCITVDMTLHVLNLTITIIYRDCQYEGVCSDENINKFASKFKTSEAIRAVDVDYCEECEEDLCNKEKTPKASLSLLTITSLIVMQITFIIK